MGESRNKLAYKIGIELAIIVGVTCMTAVFAYCWFDYYSKKMIGPYYNVGNWALIFLFFFLYRMIAEVFHTFKISITRVYEIVYCQILSLVITNFIMYIIIVLLCRSIQSVLPLFASLMMESLVALVWAFMVHKLYFYFHSPKKTVIVWDVRRGINELINLYGNENRYKVTKTVKVKQCLANISECLNGYDAVFLSGIHSHDRNKIIKYCVENDIDTYVIPRVGDMIMSAAKPLYLFHLPMVKLERFNPSIWYLFFKRIGDIVVSSLALIVLSPVMLAVAIIIKVTDGGTVFYRQCRLTVDGKEFDVLKFRSMRMDAEKDGIARLSTGAADDRITPIGRFIRAVRIDELPQLINILKGEMSVVGPRPERPEIFREYVKEMPEFALRLQTKAGLTGLAQVYGRYNTTPYDKLLMDLSYIANPSLARDFIICLATIKILFLPESTEGIAVGETTALEGSNYKKGVVKKEKAKGLDIA